MKFFLFLLIGIIFSQTLLAQNYDVTREESITNRTEKSFGLHHPNYIIAGRDDLKLQFSFKYQVMSDSNLYFGYTQLMFWDVYKYSKPFRDINFNPELFYRFPIKGHYLGHVDVGYLHTSNGKGGDESRSMDRPYINWTSYLYRENLKILSSLRLYVVTNVDDTNRDIREYAGYWDWTIYLLNLTNNSLGEGLDFGVNFFAGKKSYNLDKGGVTASLRYSFKPLKFNPDILLQYYRGHLENLLEYDKKVERIRLGLMFYF